MDRQQQIDLARMQGNLFALSASLGYESDNFVKLFMTGPVAKHLDARFDFLQWAGKEYIMEQISEAHSKELVRGEPLDRELLYWIGYIYRWWHYYTGESSREIYKQAPLKLMKNLYLAYHTLSVELAIDKIKDR